MTSKKNTSNPKKASKEIIAHSSVDAGTTQALHDLGKKHNEVATAENQVAVIAAPAKTSEFKPIQKATGAGFAPRVMGFLGYGKGTGTEALALALANEDGVTQAQLVSAYIAATGKTEKQAKSSISVFKSDSVRPFGRYYASRSLELLASRSLELLATGDGLMKFSAESIQRAESAIAANALADLKLIPEKSRIESNEKFQAFLKKFGMPVNE